MKFIRASALLFTLLMIFSVPVLTACSGRDDPAPTESSTNAADTAAETAPNTAEPGTSTATDTVTEPVVTEPDTDPPAEEPTNDPETDMPVPVETESLDGARFDVDRLAAVDVDAYLTRASHCVVEKADDPDEGCVLRFKADKITGGPGTLPTVILKYGDLIGALGGTLPSTADRPWLVMKVKAEQLWSHAARISVGTSTREADTAGTTVMSHIQNTDAWQYICFDLSGYNKEPTCVKINFEIAAGSPDDALCVSWIGLCTAEEAAAIRAQTNTYPLIAQSADDCRLKVLQFNIQTENGTAVSSELRADLLRDLLDELQPDTVGMEECTPNWRKWLNAYAFNDSYASVGEQRSPGGEANPIYYRKDKFDLVDSGTFWLSETPDVPGSAVPGANYPRICTWVILRDRETGYEFCHLNTHLDHNGSNSSADAKEIRKLQTRILLTFAATLGDRPMVLTGDFNQTRFTSTGTAYGFYKYITGTSDYTDMTGQKTTGWFADSRMNAPETIPDETAATMTKYFDESSSAYDPAHQPIDYVFYTPAAFEPLIYRSILYARDGVTLSDHLPVFAEFRFIPPQP